MALAGACGLVGRLLGAEIRWGFCRMRSQPWVEIYRNRQNLQSGFYVRGIEQAVRNFSQWRKVRIIQGPVPETLARVGTSRVSFLHLDMNCAAPEVAALEYFWEKLVAGAMVLLDDYAYVGYESQKVAMDAFAQERAVRILSLPTGQGLLVKPPEESDSIERHC
jgi:hypothetical protein